MPAIRVTDKHKSQITVAHIITFAAFFNFFYSFPIIVAYLLDKTFDNTQSKTVINTPNPNREAKL